MARNWPPANGTARRQLPVTNLTAKDRERFWTDLRDAEAVKAHAALWTLAAAPQQAVPFFKEHLHPVPRVAPDRLQRLIADLDADEFARREQASRELAKLGSEAEPALRKASDSKPSLETRRRVDALLKDLACQTEMTPNALRQLRAIQVLEQIGSPRSAEHPQIAGASRSRRPGDARCRRRMGSPQLPCGWFPRSEVETTVPVAASFAFLTANHPR
jgi:hypothetical protein